MLIDRSVDFKVILQIVIALRGDFNGCLNLEMKKKEYSEFHVDSLKMYK